MIGLSRCVLPIVLTLTAGAPSAFAQPLACYPIQRGDTASQLARRLTGDARNKYQSWFQIVDPAARFVPKSQYDRVRPGWRACVVKAPVTTRSAGGEHVVRANVTKPVEPTVDPNPAPTPASIALPTSRAIDFTAVWLAPAVIVAWLGWQIVEVQLSRRKTTLIVMRHFANQFVREFERPLGQHGADRPLQAQFRVRPLRGQLEILLAPGAGRRYPNLSDHRKNVEYDVVRVMHVLGDESFTCGPLYGQAEWVVVPFQFRVGMKQPGVACISSF